MEELHVKVPPQPLLPMYSSPKNLKCFKNYQFLWDNQVNVSDSWISENPKAPSMNTQFDAMMYIIFLKLWFVKRNPNSEFWNEKVETAEYYRIEQLGYHVTLFETRFHAGSILISDMSQGSYICLVGFLSNSLQVLGFQLNWLFWTRAASYHRKVNRIKTLWSR